MASRLKSRRSIRHQQLARGYVLTNDFGSYRTSATASTKIEETIATLTSASVTETMTTSLQLSSTSLLATVASSSSSSPSPSLSSMSSSATLSSSLSSNSASPSSYITSSSAFATSVAPSSIIPVRTSTSASIIEDEPDTSALVVTRTLQPTAVRSNLASVSASARVVSAAASDPLSLSGGSIAGIIVAAVAFVAAVTMILISRQKSRNRRRAATTAYASYLPDGDRDRISVYESGSDEIMGDARIAQHSDGWRLAEGPRLPTMIESGRLGMGAGGASIQRSPPAPTFSMAPQPSSPTVSSHSTDDYGFPDPRALGRASAANSSYLLAQSPWQATFASGPLQNQTSPEGAPSHPYAVTYPTTPASTRHMYQTPIQATIHSQHEQQMFITPPPDPRVLTQSPPTLQQQHANGQSEPGPHALNSPPMQAAALTMRAPSYTPHATEQQSQPMLLRTSHAWLASVEASSWQSQARRSVYDTDDAYGGM